MSNVEPRVSLNIDVPPSATRFDHNARCYLESRKVNWFLNAKYPGMYMWRFFDSSGNVREISCNNATLFNPCRYSYRNRAQPIENITSIVKLLSWFFFFVFLSFYIILLLCNFFFSFMLNITHFNLGIHGIRNTIIYNYDFILLILYDSLVFELIIFFWQLKVIRSLNLIRWYDIFQFFDHSQSWLVYLIIFTKEEENNIEILKNFSMQNSL